MPQVSLDGWPGVDEDPEVCPSPSALAGGPPAQPAQAAVEVPVVVLGQGVGGQSAPGPLPIPGVSAFDRPGGRIGEGHHPDASTTGQPPLGIGAAHDVPLAEAGVRPVLLALGQQETQVVKGARLDDAQAHGPDASCRAAQPVEEVRGGAPHVHRRSPVVRMLGREFMQRRRIQGTACFSPMLTISAFDGRSRGPSHRTHVAIYSSSPRL